VALIFIPVFIIIGIIPETVIVGLFGYKWIESVPLVMPISLALVFHALLSLAGPLIEGCGKIEKEISTQSGLIFVQIGVLFICSYYSLESIAWIIAMIFFARFLMLNQVVSKILALSYADLFLSIKGAILVSVIAGFFVKVTDILMALINIAPFNRLLLDLFVGLCLFIIIVFKYRHYVVIKEISDLILSNKLKLPLFLVRCFN
jgi:O-antigen/teichoic acid export membrane protein